MILRTNIRPQCRISIIRFFNSQSCVPKIASSIDLSYPKLIDITLEREGELGPDLPRSYIVAPIGSYKSFKISRKTPFDWIQARQIQR